MRSKRRMVGGASATSLTQAPHAPSTMLRMVPLPRFVSLRGGGWLSHKQNRSRDASAPELCSRRRTTKTNEQKREAERREAHPTMAASCDAARARRQVYAVCATHLLEARSPFGAPLRRLPERANAPAQPRPRFTRTRGCGRYPHRHSRLSKAPCTPVLMPAGHSSLGANCVHCCDTRTARERSYELRPQEPHPLRFRDRLEKRPS